MSNSRFSQFKAVGFLLLLLALPGAMFGAEADATVNTNGNSRSEVTQASNDIQRAYLQLQQQIHEAKLTVERMRQESDEAAARSADAVTTRLQTMEQTVAQQRMRELEAIQSTMNAMQSTTRFMLTVLFAFAALGFLAVVLTGYFQWRTVNRLSEVSNSLNGGPGLASSPAIAALGLGESHLVTTGVAVEQSNTRLLTVVERLEKRVHELENTSNGSPAKHVVIGNGGSQSATETSTNPAIPASHAPDETMALLEKGQSLLTADQADEAIACFDEVLSLDPNNAEALVKKGAALEKLRKPQEAIECYNRAIAADSSMTIAYLHKGGLYNRMERFSEAVECYEQALRTQEKRSGT